MQHRVKVLDRDALNAQSAGVSQRDVTDHFPALAAQTDDLAEALLEFHEQRMQSSGFALPDCARSAHSDTSF